MKYVVRERKPIPFSWRFEKEMIQNGSSLESDMVSLRVFQKRKKMNSQKCSRENWKGLKKLTKFAQNTRFSRLRQVARTSRRNTKKKTLENFLSVFRDWSIYLPMSRQWVAKNLCDGLATGACDWFYPWLSCQNRAKLFLKFLTIFAKTKYFPKTTKILKNRFVIDQHW